MWPTGAVDSRKQGLRRECFVCKISGAINRRSDHRRGTVARCHGLHFINILNLGLTPQALAVARSRGLARTAPSAMLPLSRIAHLGATFQRLYHTHTDWEGLHDVSILHKLGVSTSCSTKDRRPLITKNTSRDCTIHRWNNSRTVGSH